MGFKDIIKRLRDRRERDKEQFKQAQAEDKIHTLVEERKKSANQREYERFGREEKEAQYKKILERLRKERHNDLAYGHNPAMVKNITARSQANIMKPKSLFRHKHNNMKETHKVYKSKSILKGGKKVY